jgi:acetyl esterase/lipase
MELIAHKLTINQNFQIYTSNVMKKITLFLLVSIATHHTWAQQTTRETSQIKKPEPTYTNYSYGPHERQVFDIWLTPSKNGEPTPLVVYIHGGGFRGGNKNTIRAGSIDQFVEAGLSVAAIHYRLSDAGPYPIMMEDAARCLQTIRSHAKEWNLNPDKVACYGGSAGAGISLWLGFHDDLGDPGNEDSIARQSTRIVAAATQNGQSTYDLHTFRDWFGTQDLEISKPLYPLFDVKSESEWDSERVRKLMKDASPITHLTKDDIPVYMSYRRDNVPVDENTPANVWVHHPKLGLKLQEAMKTLGLECEVHFPMNPVTTYESIEAFLIEKLTN